MEPFVLGLIAAIGAALVFIPLLVTCSSCFEIWRTIRGTNYCSPRHRNHRPKAGRS
jgi:hypothetical protein